MDIMVFIITVVILFMFVFIVFHIDKVLKNQAQITVNQVRLYNLLVLIDKRIEDSTESSIDKEGSNE